jgi:hypothetical protein
MTIVKGPWQRDGLTQRSEPPDDGGMELSERVAKIEAVIPTLATKEDLVREVGGLRSELHKELHAMTWKIWAFAAGLVTIVFGLAKLIK